MRRLIGSVKLLAAFMLFSSVTFGVIEAFDPDEVGVSLFGTAVFLLIGAPYVYYLVHTGMADWKDADRRMNKLDITGLILHMALCCFAIYYSATDFTWFWSLALAAMVGLAIGWRDIRWRRGDRSGPPVVEQPLDLDADVQVQVRLEEREWIRLNFILAYRSPIILMATAFGVLALLGAVLAAASHKTDGPTVPMVSVVIGLFMLLIPVWIKRASVKNLRENPFLNQDLRLTLSKDGIRGTTSSVEMSTRWKEVRSNLELREWFVFMTEANRGFFIPKRVLDADQIAIVRANSGRVLGHIGR